MVPTIIIRWYRKADNDSSLTKTILEQLRQITQRDRAMALGSQRSVLPRRMKTNKRRWHQTRANLLSICQHCKSERPNARAEKERRAREEQLGGGVKKERGEKEKKERREKE